MLRSAACLITILATLLACSEEPPNTPPVRGGAGSAFANGGASGSGSAGGSVGGSAGTADSGSGATGGGKAAAGAVGLGGSGGFAGDGAAAGAGGQASLLEGIGFISYERWLDIKGEAVTLVPIADLPDVTLELTTFQMPNDVGQDFAARMRGFLTAPETGSYTFWLSCDDNGELSLSTDETPASKQRLAHVTGSPAWTDYVEWTKFPTQKSQAIRLVAGKRYYIEALLKEDVAEDHLAVGWSKPSDPSGASEPHEIIPGKQLSPFE